MSVRTSSLFLVVLLVSHSGCIVTYRDSSNSSALRLSHKRDDCTHHVSPHRPVSYGQTEGGTYQWTYSGAFSPMGMAPLLEDALQRYAGCSSSRDFVYSSMEPGTEVVVTVQDKPYPWRWYGENLGWISSKLYLIFPFILTKGAGNFLTASIHQNVLTKTYKYEITARQFYWILLLPFSWMNVFTHSLRQDGVQSTTAQFVVDAQREGYGEQ